VNGSSAPSSVRAPLADLRADVRRIHFIDGVDGMAVGEIDPFDLAGRVSRRPRRRGAS